MSKPSELLMLNPRYVYSAFGSQARNLSTSKNKTIRKLACLMQSIAKHILKCESVCYASSYTLLKSYKSLSKNYGVSPISDRTLSKQLKQAEELGLIGRTHSHDRELGISRRNITICLKGLKAMFKGVFNLAASNAEKHHNREKVRSGRPSVEKHSQPRGDKPSKPMRDPKSCGQRSKDLSKESKEIEKREGKALPSDNFFVHYFGQFADEMKSLQLAARNKSLTGAGAKRYVKIYALQGYPIAEKFNRYLRRLIGQDNRQRADKARFNEFMRRTEV